MSKARLRPAPRPRLKAKLRPAIALHVHEALPPDLAWQRAGPSRRARHSRGDLGFSSDARIDPRTGAVAVAMAAQADADLCRTRDTIAAAAD